MSFTVRVTFTGLGLALVHAKKEEPEDITGVDLLLVDSSVMDHHDHGSGAAHHDQGDHRPLLTFRLDDLAHTKEEDFPGPHVTAQGLPLVEVDLTKQDLKVSLTGSSGRFKLKRPFLENAVKPGFLASKKAINWIPDAEKKMGIPISDIIIPSGSLDGSPYISRVTLPPGDISSSSLLIRSDGTLREATFGEEDKTRHALAEQIIWTREGVDRLEIPYKGGLLLDALVRNLQDEDEIVDISVTNLPALFLPERFPFPDHFLMYRLIRKSGDRPNRVRPAPDEQVTRGGTCPPLYAEFFS